MSKKVINMHWIICVFIWAIAAIGCVLSLTIEKDTAENILYAVVVLLVCFIALLFTPVCIEFDKTSITIYFLFGFFQKATWDSIWKIERQCKPSDIRYYKVYGDFYGKTAFFTSPQIPYNRKIQRLLREYWNADFKK